MAVNNWITFKIAYTWTYKVVQNGPLNYRHRRVQSPGWGVYDLVVHTSSHLYAFLPPWQGKQLPVVSKWSYRLI